MRKDRFKLIPIVNIILGDDDKILLMKRSDGFFKGGFWVVPAGHVDGNETIPVATARELKEELGLDIDPNDVEVVHVVHNLEDTREKLDFFVRVKIFHGEIVNLEPEKCEEIKFFRYNELPPAEKMAGTTLLALSGISEKRFYSERGFAEGKNGFSASDKLTFDGLQYMLAETLGNEMSGRQVLQKLSDLLQRPNLSEVEVQNAFSLICELIITRGLSIKDCAFEALQLRKRK